MPEELLENARCKCPNGLIAVLIPEGVVCEHVFVVYIDAHGHVRERLSKDEIRHQNQKRLVQYKTLEDMLSHAKARTLAKIRGRL
ncbi:MAG: hypothetical protein Kow0069_25180 [Promethearchaeota archaeon]